MKKILTLLFALVIMSFGKEYKVAEFNWIYYNSVWETTSSEEANIRYNTADSLFYIYFQGGADEICISVSDFTDLRKVLNKYEKWKNVAITNNATITVKTMFNFNELDIDGVYIKPALTNDWCAIYNYGTSTFSFTSNIEDNSYILAINIVGTYYVSGLSMDAKDIIFFNQNKCSRFENVIKEGKEAQYKASVNKVVNDESLFN